MQKLKLEDLSKAFNLYLTNQAIFWYNFWQTEPSSSRILFLTGA